MILFGLTVKTPTGKLSITKLQKEAFWRSSPSPGLPGRPVGFFSMPLLLDRMGIASLKVSEVPRMPSHDP
jgi:hypothetical protein